MTAADVAAIAKPWELQHETAKQVADEFFDQGDMERMQLGINPMWMMDRERKDELPQMQVGFIDVVCRPLYTTLSESFPWIKPLLDGCLANREKWADLAEKVSLITLFEKLNIFSLSKRVLSRRDPSTTHFLLLNFALWIFASNLEYHSRIHSLLANH